MKKITLLITLMLLAMAAVAQGTINYGCYDGSQATKAWGTSKGDLQYDIAIHLNDPALVGKQVSAVIVPIQVTYTITNWSVWLTKELKVENKQNVPDICSVPFEPTIEQGEMVIQLPEPYTITEEGVFVGFSFTCGSLNASTINPTVVMENYDPEMMYLHTNKSYGQWKSRNPGFGVSTTMRAVLTGVDGDAAALGTAHANNGRLGAPTACTFEVLNHGSNGVSNIDYSYSINGIDGTGHANVAIGAHYNKAASVGMQIPALGEAGTHTLSITLDKVNGVDNPDKNTIEVPVTIFEHLFPRNVLIEEFTTEKCPNCPPMAATFKRMLEGNPDIAAQVSVICRHAGYYTDSWTNAADKAFTWFYNDNGATYAPAFMFDRVPYDIGSNSGKPTPCVFPSGVNGFLEYINDRLNAPAYSGLDMSAEYNEDGTLLTVTVTSMRDPQFNEEARLVVTLTEDEIKAISQSGASNYIHEHLVRAYSSVWGDVVEWNEDNTETRTYTFDIDPTWKKDDLKVVAYLSKYNSSDPADCEVFNSLTINAPASEPATGDVNGDNEVNIADVNAVIDMILGGASTPQGDVNGDGEVNIADVNAVIDMILK